MIDELYPNSIRRQRFEEADRLFFRPLLEEWARRGYYMIPITQTDDNGRSNKTS